jgi:hypothetical protein
MAHQREGRFFNLFGILVWGDLGPLTLYRNRRKKIVVFKKTIPRAPPSAEQKIQRQNFRYATIAWKQLPIEKKRIYKIAAQRVSLCMTGYNLFILHRLSKDPVPVETVFRQAKVTPP